VFLMLAEPAEGPQRIVGPERPTRPRERRCMLLIALNMLCGKNSSSEITHERLALG
jgi:hypothetical protein